MGRKSKPKKTDEEPSEPAPNPKRSSVLFTSTASTDVDYVDVGATAAPITEKRDAVYVLEDEEYEDSCSDDDTNVEVLLKASEGGVMAPKVAQHGSAVIWEAGTDTMEAADNKEVAEKAAEFLKKKREEGNVLDEKEELKARILEDKAKLQKGLAEAREKESKENAGRDPCLFSKRSAYDIDLTGLEDKPWQRSTNDSDFFNYGMHETDWISYCESQKIIRQELTDAMKQRRNPDRNIVPCEPIKLTVARNLVEGENAKEEEEEQRVVVIVHSKPGSEEPNKAEKQKALEAHANKMRMKRKEFDVNNVGAWRKPEPNGRHWQLLGAQDMREKNTRIYQDNLIAQHRQAELVAAQAAERRKQREADVERHKQQLEEFKAMRAQGGRGGGGQGMPGMPGGVAGGRGVGAPNVPPPPPPNVPPPVPPAYRGSPPGRGSPPSRGGFGGRGMGGRGGGRGMR